MSIRCLSGVDPGTIRCRCVDELGPICAVSGFDLKLLYQIPGAAAHQDLTSASTPQCLLPNHRTHHSLGSATEFGQSPGMPWTSPTSKSKIGTRGDRISRPEVLEHVFTEHRPQLRTQLPSRYVFVSPRAELDENWSCRQRDVAVALPGLPVTEKLIFLDFGVLSQTRKIAIMSECCRSCAVALSPDDVFCRRFMEQI